MRIEYIKKPTLMALFVPAILFLFAYSSAFAFVSGRCDGCHTMHNSQDGNQIAQYYNPATHVKELSPTPIASLLVSDCVTCHTNPSGGAGTYTLNTYPVPVVFTTVLPTQVTAGGNFYYTVGGTAVDDNKGHNVRGITGQDGALSRAPGAGSIGCNGSCHDSLTKLDADTTPASGSNVKTNGCQGCHLKVGHHSRNSGLEGGVAGEAGDAFRFLSGHDNSIVGFVPNGLGLWEDPDWEIDYDPGPGTLHNIYKAQGGNPEKHPEISIGRWCAGCHSDFHAYGELDELTGTNNMGDRNAQSIAIIDPGNRPWLRHPTNVRFPTDGEFDWVNVESVAYNTDIPVARGQMDRANIRGNDQVMCLSCHKAHASNYPNSLRWDYDAVIAHDPLLANAGETTVGGCFFCHRTKDDV